MAYTKYSLTPANNTAAPPDGAPEGMLPSAVNDTMRDMMAQIRDCGDGIRDGTYTMTAPKITGGTITGATFTGNTFSNPIITGVSTFAAGTVSAPAITTTGDTNTGIFFPAADTIAFTEGGVESMRIDSNGNLGLGITPQTWYLNSSVYGAFQFGAGALLYGRTTSSAVNLELSTNSYLDTSAAYRYLFTGEASRYAQASGAHIWSSAASGTAGNSFSYSERMRIDSSGNVGIGTSSPSTRLDVRCVSDVTQDIAYFSRPDAAVRAKIALDGSGIINFGTSTNHPLAFLTNNTERMRIDSGGALLIGVSTASTTLFQEIKYTTTAAGTRYINTSSSSSTVMDFVANSSQVGSISTSGSATTYSTSSDYRLKENIAPMTGALDKVAQLKPCTYTWKLDGKDGQGFIAHELQAVCPDAVVGEKDAVDADGNIKPQGIDTSFLVATLTAAIQELKTELDSVKAELQTLKGN